VTPRELLDVYQIALQLDEDVLLVPWQIVLPVLALGKLGQLDQLLHDRSHEVLLAFRELVGFPVSLNLVEQPTELSRVAQVLYFVFRGQIVVVKIDGGYTTLNLSLDLLLRPVTEVEVGS